MKQKSVGLTLRAFILALVLSLVAGSPALPPFDGVAYAQSSGLQASVAPDNSNVTLTWDAVTGADSYQIWRGEVVGGSAQWGTSAYDTVTAPAVTYTDDSVTAGATYAYGVRSVTGGTAASWMGPYPNVTIGGGTAAPTARPSVTVVADGTTAVNVSWTSVAGATHFAIQFWHAGLDDWERISGDHDQAAGYNHPGLTPGTEYYYVVAAVNAGGMGPWSSWRTDDSKITLQATTATPVLDVDHTSRTVVELSWTPAPADSTYNLHRRKVTTDSADTPVSNPADDSGWARLPSGLLTTTSYTDNAANYVPNTTGLTDTAVPIIVRYEYRVQAIDSNDVAGDWSAVKRVSIPSAGTVLAAPPNFGASAVSSSSTRVTWGEVTGAAFYELKWKSGDGNYTTPFREDGTTYGHLDLSPSTKYTYQVRAVDINGAGRWSIETSTTTLSVTAAAGQMPKVRNLKVADATTNNTGTTRTAKLTWSAVSGATHYEIQRFNPGLDSPAWADAPDGKELVGGFIPEDDAGSSPSWEDVITTSADGGAGQTYYYVVSAVNEGIDVAVTSAADNELGEWSDFKSVTFRDFKPAAPTGLSADKTNGGSIMVRWTQPDAARAAGTPTGEATSWTILWWTAANTSERSIAVTGGTSYHHTGQSGNTTYLYKVRAENSGGMSAETEIASEVLGNTLTAPRNVRAVDATDGTTVRIKVLWNAVTGADSYEIQRFGAGSTDDEWGSLADTENEVTDVPTGTEQLDDYSALMPSTTYLYRVRTVQEMAMSAWSDVTSGTTAPAAVTDAPTLLATTTGQSMIRLSWEAVPGATAYHLEHLEGVQAEDVFSNPNTNPPRITISGNFRNYVHTGRKAGTQYSYRLRAVLPSGEGEWTVPAEATQPWTKPATPDLTASATDSDTIELTWDAVPVGSNYVGVDANGSYRVEWRIKDSGDAWQDVTEAVSCPSDGTNKCTLIDDVLMASKHYQYRIRAEAAGTAGGHNSYWDYTNQRTPAASSN